MTRWLPHFAVCAPCGRESGGGIESETEMSSKNKANCRGLMPDGIEHPLNERKR